ncbi:hypothetical protein ACRALDRAFT_1067214 [Sodiomyces alcalophilus JCM 7366]|uniref:uncharacterized protein n=1 Tax=Sodiomyces alcalophilus JCM 7366 TaxID=591952 RepID=UPI0039B47B46
MTRSSHYYMPGAYLDSQATGIHPSVFRPPISSSAASSMHLAQSAASLVSENASSAMQAKRKRNQNDSSREQTPLQEWSGSDVNMNMDGAADHVRRLDTPAAGGLEGANLGRYTLAGQLETPGGAARSGENGSLENSLYSDSDYRKALGSKRPFAETESPANGHPNLLVNPNRETEPSEGWSKLAFSTIGGVVGKFWEFCKTGAFKGFYAGGGEGYALNNHLDSKQQAPRACDPRAANGANIQEAPNANGYFPTFNPSAVANHMVPGGFPQSDYAPYRPECFENTMTPDSTPSRPAAKRRQLDEADELRRNWIVVDEPASTRKRNPRPVSRVSARGPSRSSRPSISTGRRISVPASRLHSTPTAAAAAAAATAASPRRTPHAYQNRISHAGSPSLSPREPASFASARLSFSTPSSPAVPSPSRIPVPSRPAGGGVIGPNPFARPSSSADSYHRRDRSGDAGGAPYTHRRTQSGASAASPRAPKTRDEAILLDSPRLTPEAKKLAAKRRRAEQDADMRMNDLNTRLKEMIRQGKEALGTKVEVMGDAGGWESDDE